MFFGRFGLELGVNRGRIGAQAAISVHHGLMSPDIRVRQDADYRASYTAPLPLTRNDVLSDIISL